MKGVINLAIIGLIVIVGIILMIILPAMFLRLHLIQTVNYVYEYDNSQLYLLTLLTITYDGNSVYTQIANNLQVGKPDVSFVKDELDKITDNRCYDLSSSTKVIAKSECVPSENTVEVPIVLPYKSNHLTDKLELVID